MDSALPLEREGTHRELLERIAEGRGMRKREKMEREKDKVRSISALTCIFPTSSQAEGIRLPQEGRAAGAPPMYPPIQSNEV